MKKNTIRLGPPNGPWLDIISLKRRVPTITQISQLVSRTHTPQTWGAAADVLPRSLAKTVTMRRHKSVVGYLEEEQLIIALTYKENSDGVTALRTIDSHADDPLPPAITAALVAALSAKEPSSAPATFAYYASTAPASMHTPLNRRQVDEAAKNWLNEMGSGREAPMPRNGTSRGRMLVIAGKMLWDEDVAKQVALGYLTSDQVPPHLLALSSLAHAAHQLRDTSHVVYAGQRLNLADQTQVWPQYLEFVRGDISSQAVSFLCGSSFPQSNDHIIWLGDAPTNPNALVIEDQPSAAAWAKSLVRDAEDNGVFVPSGGFRLAFPRGYPLREWGMLGLRVHADPEGLWVSTHPNRGENVFRWKPGVVLNPILISEKVAPLMDITLSALWRDMRVAGETVVRQRTGRKQRTSKPSATPESETSVRYLPRRRLIFDGEAREWGSKQEHEVIQRQKHGVAFHFRRLLDRQQASGAARENAADFGYVVIPEGYTFVKPHVRGHGEEKAKKTITVVAQGLQAATIFLDQQRN